MNIVATSSIYCGFNPDFQFLKPVEYYGYWKYRMMTDEEYQLDQLEKSVGTLENSINILVSDLKELRKKRKLLKMFQDIDHLAWAKIVGVELHMREIEKTIQNCELTKSIVSNELACKDIPISSKEAKDGYDPKFTHKERRLIEENLKKEIIGKKGEKKRAKMEAKLERMQLGEREYNESRNKKKNVKELKKMLFKREKKNGMRKEKAANNKVEY